MVDPIYCTVFINWPCAKGEVWAAWAQAILSAVAILAAARIANWQIRSADRKRVEACMMLIGHIQVSVGTAADELEINAKNGLAKAVSLQALQNSIEAMRAMPIDTIPDIRLYTPLIGARSFGETALKAVEAINQSLKNGHNQPAGSAEMLRDLADKLLIRYEAAERVSNSYKPCPVRAAIFLKSRFDNHAFVSP